MASGGLDLNNKGAPRSNLARPLTGLSVLLLFIPMFLVFPGVPGVSERSLPGILINEILYDPIGSDVSGEFVELYNPTEIPVNMEGWSVSDQDGTGPDIILKGLSLPAKGFLVIFTGPGTNDTDMSDGKGHLYLGRSDSIWSNTGDDVLLSDKTDHPIDYMCYGDGSSIDPPPMNITWAGTVPVVPEGYSLGRLPDGNGTTAPLYFLPLKPTPGEPNKMDPPPSLLGWDLEPKSPRAFQDLFVWASITDEVRVDKVLVRVKGGDGMLQDQNMTWDQAQSRYKATLKGRAGGQTLELWIIASDPLSQSMVSSHQNISFKINTSTQLVATLTGPEGAVLPGAALDIQGHVLWLNGSKVSGNVTATIPDTRGSWKAPFEDYIVLSLVAPSIEGTYDIKVQVRSGEALFEQSLSLEVRWPYKTLLCSLSTAYASGSDFVTGQDIFLNGSIKFSDGLPASNARASFHIIGTDTSLDLKANQQGDLRIKIKTPSIAGTYVFELGAQAMGKNASASVSVVILDNLSLNLSKLPKLYNLKGEAFIVAGQVKHHDGKPSSNSLVVIEIIGSNHKVRTFTGLDGKFNCDLVAPYYKGQYELRITAVSGEAIAQKDINLFIGERNDPAKPTPGWNSLVVLLGILVAVCLYHKR
jgi:hypothetical protein